MISVASYTDPSNRQGALDLEGTVYIATVTISSHLLTNKIQLAGIPANYIHLLLGIFSSMIQYASVLFVRHRCHLRAKGFEFGDFRKEHLPSFPPSLLKDCSGLGSKVNHRNDCTRLKPEERFSFSISSCFQCRPTNVWSVPTRTIIIKLFLQRCELIVTADRLSPPFRASIV